MVKNLELQENFKCLVKEYYKQFNIDWTVDGGISPRCVNSICKKYDISHYVFDISKKSFVQNISKNRNHKAFIYFAVNNHMYLILEDAVRKSLVEKQKLKKVLTHHYSSVILPMHMCMY
jgi:hypothetical protein